MTEEELISRLYNKGNIDALLVRNEEAFKRQQESANVQSKFKKCLEIIDNIDRNC